MSNVILTPVPLTAEAFAPYGVVFELGKDRPGDRDAFAAPMENLREDARLNVSVSRPKPVALPLKVEWLERHPFSSQTFVPLDLSRHLLLGCPSLPDGAPDITKAVTFIGASTQGVMYRHNVWHHPFTGLDRNGETIMLRYDDGGDMDTEWFQVEDGPTIHDNI